MVVMEIGSREQQQWLVGTSLGAETRQPLLRPAGARPALSPFLPYSLQVRKHAASVEATGRS